MLLNTHGISKIYGFHNFVSSGILENYQNHIQIFNQLIYFFVGSFAGLPQHCNQGLRTAVAIPGLSEG